MTCAWGLDKLGLMLICYGVTDAITSGVLGALVKCLGPLPIFIFGAMVNVVATAALLLWAPDSRQSAMFYVIAALWGMADSVWQIQING